MPNDFLQIKPLLIAVLETALNAYLVLDDRIEEYLCPMAGKVLAIHVTPFDETLYLCPATDRMQLLEHYEGEADATLSGSLSALGLMVSVQRRSQNRRRYSACAQATTAVRKIGHQSGSQTSALYRKSVRSRLKWTFSWRP